MPLENPTFIEAKQNTNALQTNDQIKSELKTVLDEKNFAIKTTKTNLENLNTQVTDLNNFKNFLSSKDFQYLNILDKSVKNSTNKKLLDYWNSFKKQLLQYKNIDAENNVDLEKILGRVVLQNLEMSQIQMSGNNETLAGELLLDLREKFEKSFFDSNSKSFNSNSLNSLNSLDSKISQVSKINTDPTINVVGNTIKQQFESINPDVQKMAIEGQNSKDVDQNSYFDNISKIFASFSNTQTYSKELVDFLNQTLKDGKVLANKKLDEKTLENVNFLNSKLENMSMFFVQNPGLVEK